MKKKLKVKLLEEKDDFINQRFYEAALNSLMYLSCFGQLFSSRYKFC